MWRGRRRLGVLRVLAGVPGVGKSAGLAWCCLWDRPTEAREREALWVHASALAPRTGWSESAALWERWQRVPLLASTTSASRRATPRWCRACCSPGGMRAS